MEYFIGALKKYADFTGRARRKEYWMFILCYALLYVAFVVIDLITGIELLTAVYSIALLIPSLSIAARRLHDTGRSGWWQLIALIPVIGWIILIVFLAQDSHDDNKYGANPKAGM
ncbi:DUF805 domain-containing protein [Enterovibrio sp. ZSDZ35]|uniref:DUF805 domain-containing protein n=1 Tax=Enterovibrio qingdaonensis TaxID=2899818 RepID=A0ABT5QRU2_9GAMM|nr:DUF805 domain-containing protein [Enterovibrio sp. ZSDZ35]MDD1783619.1 DUF805 domain-containing protein [Enterovibrio sp. ZSDZ35]